MSGKGKAELRGEIRGLERAARICEQAAATCDGLTNTPAAEKLARYEQSCYLMVRIETMRDRLKARPTPQPGRRMKKRRKAK